MKNLLIILFVLIASVGFCQMDTSVYLGKTKKEIMKSLKNDFDNVSKFGPLYVVADKDGGWYISNEHYTYVISYAGCGNFCYTTTFTFNKYSNTCVCYHEKIDGLSNYYLYMDYFNQVYIKSKDKELTWYDKKGLFEIVLHAYKDASGAGIYYVKQ